MVRLMTALAVLLPPPPAIVLEDQFEKVHDVREYRGDVVVILYGDRSGANANQTLGERLHVTFHPQAKGLPPAQARKAPVRPVPGAPAGARSPDVRMVPVACIGPVPGLVRALIRGRFRSASPDVPVWLDFQDLMKKQFPFRPGGPNLVVLDTHGRHRYTATGPVTPQDFDQIVAVIEQLRREK
jgi:hypothetical protein